jgi:hypothetical protein
MPDRSPALIRVINRCFSMSVFSSNSLSTVAVPLSNFPITGRHHVDLNLAISVQNGLSGLLKDFESLLMCVLR